MAWPVNARYQTFIATTTTITAAFMNAVQDAVYRLVGGSRSVAKVLVDGVGDVANAYASGTLVATGGRIIADGDPATDKGRIQYRQSVTTGAAIPTIAASAPTTLGAGYAGLAVLPLSNDSAGEVSFQTGVGSGTGNLVVVTLNKPYPQPPKVVLSPGSLVSAAVGWAVTATTAAGGAGGEATFTIAATAAIADTTVYLLTYHVIGVE